MADLLLAARDAGARSRAHLISLQHVNGCWEGEVVWSPLILAQMTIVREIVRRPWPEALRAEAIRHFAATRTPEGGWGLHPESPATVFVTTLSYVALRFLGVEAADERVAAARRWLEKQPGGVLAIPTWGKFWLALLGLYGWEGVKPCPPEAVLLPSWVALHPRNLYCHTRHIYLSMAYLYGKRWRADPGATTQQLGRELYGAQWPKIDFRRHRADVRAAELYAPPGRALQLLTRLIAAGERIRLLRRRALEKCLDHILFEQRQSRYEGLSPVNGLLNCLAIWSSDPAHPDLEPSLAGLESWRWHDPQNGLRYAGARSNAWDTAFAMHALFESRDEDSSARAASARGYSYLRDTQLIRELKEGRRHWRDSVEGGWCFSDGAHRWPVADCTAEALSAVLKMTERTNGRSPADPPISAERLRQAVQFVLDRQNPDGGFATYEKRRGPLWLESLNPSEMFGQCMTERSYVECTGSCLAALARFRACTGTKEETIDRAISRAVAYLKRQQLPDGSFPAAWGIQFTYSIFFAVEGLRSAGIARSDPMLRAAADWLLAKQKQDGGWGEHYSGCLTGEYREHPQSQVTMTSWALLALLEILGAEHDAVDRGITWLCRNQEPNGSWPRGAVNGVFFRTAMLDYRMYGVYFPAWAIARYASYRLSRSPEVRPSGSFGASRGAGTGGRGEGLKERGSIPTGSHSSHPPSSFNTLSARAH